MSEQSAKPYLVRAICEWCADNGLTPYLAVKVNDLEEATKFYTEVFGFTEVKTGRNREHISRHMTDGHIDFTLMQYDSEDSHEATIAGEGPRLHHWGVTVDDLLAAFYVNVLTGLALWIQQGR